MILNGQQLFLASITVGAFVFGTLAGSFLTYGPPASSADRTIAGADQPAFPQGTVATIETTSKTPETKLTLAPGLEIGSVASREAEPTAPSPESSPLVADQASTASASALDQVQASSQAHNGYPAAFPEANAIRPGQPALQSEAAQSHVAHVTKAALTPRPWEAKAVKVRQGDSLTTILKRSGIEGGEIHAALQSLRGVYDPRSLRAGDELAITAATRESQSAQLLSVAFDLSFDHRLLITRDADGGFTTKKIEQVKRRELVHREGEIEASLYLSASRQAIPNAVTERLIRMFSWDVDFQRDIHPGDRFETLYEEVKLEKDESQVKGELVYAGLKVRGELIDAYLYSPDGGRSSYYDRNGRSLRKFLLRTPIDGARLSSHFGMRKHPILGYSRMHKGTDFAAPRGTPIFAGGSGKIEVAGRNGGYGNYIRIRHNNTYSTAYAHLNKFAKDIKVGARVRQGQVIGYVGTTGRSTGPHLHYEVMKNGTQVNPMKMKHPPAIQLEGTELAAFKKEVTKIDGQRAKLAKEQRLASHSSANNAE